MLHYTGFVRVCSNTFKVKQTLKNVFDKCTFNQNHKSYYISTQSTYTETIVKGLYLGNSDT